MTGDKSDASREESVLLAALDTEARAKLLQQGAKRRFAAGETIFARGDEGSSIFIIASGRVEISITSMNGRKSVLNHMGPNEVLGEVAMIDRGTRSADATAANDVEGTLIGRADITRFLGQHPEATMGLVEELCAKVRNASEMFEVQSQVQANIRLARCLLRIGEKWGQPFGDGYVIEQPFSQSDIGEIAGLARENVNRHLKSMIQNGIVSQEGRLLTILDAETLRDIAEL